MPENEFEKVTVIVAAFKITESMHKSVTELSQRHNRKINDQIRELLKLGLEKTKEDADPTYRRSELREIVGLLMEEKMGHYPPTPKPNDYPA